MKVNEEGIGNFGPNRILESVKDSITQTTEKTEESASYFVLGLTAAILVAVVIVLGGVASKKAKISSYDQQIQTDVTDQLKNLNKEQGQISSVFTQLDTLEASLNKRIKYSSVFADLAKNQYQKSKWTDVTVKDGTVSINGEANSFEDVAKTVIALKNLSSVKDVKLTSANLNQEKQVVSYSVNMALDLTTYKNPLVSPTPTASKSSEVLP